MVKNWSVILFLPLPKVSSLPLFDHKQFNFSVFRLQNGDDVLSLLIFQFLGVISCFKLFLLEAFRWNLSEQPCTCDLHLWDKSAVLGPQFGSVLCHALAGHWTHRGILETVSKSHSHYTRRRERISSWLLIGHYWETWVIRKVFSQHKVFKVCMVPLNCVISEWCTFPGRGRKAISL